MTIGRILTLKKHQSHADMRTLPTPFAETVQIAPDMQHSTAGVTPVLTIWVSHNAHFVAIGHLRADLDPFSDHTLVRSIETSQFAEYLECFFVSASASEPSR
jgi:hypothetical protein